MINFDNPRWIYQTLTRSDLMGVPLEDLDLLEQLIAETRNTRLQEEREKAIDDFKKALAQLQRVGILRIKSRESETAILTREGKMLSFFDKNGKAW